MRCVGGCVVHLTHLELPELRATDSRLVFLKVCLFPHTCTVTQWSVTAVFLRCKHGLVAVQQTGQLTAAAALLHSSLSKSETCGVMMIITCASHRAARLLLTITAAQTFLPEEEGGCRSDFSIDTTICDALILSSARLFTGQRRRKDPARLC